MMQTLIAQRYELKTELGTGGMGTVYLGQDTLTQTPVAIKQLHAHLADAPLIERFKREGDALRELNHPNIVKMLDAVEQDGKHYLVMEYVSGSDLSDLLKNGKLPLEKILNMSIDLADALTRAHRLHIIHRDLKPANILIGADGVLRLTDFGVAHIGSKERVTVNDTVVGTIHYLPPEAFDGMYNERSDIWAFGVILLEMLTGKHPFDGETILQVIQAITTQPLPDYEQLQQDVPINLIDLIYRMLERDPLARLSSVRYVGAMLEDILKGRETHSSEIGRFDTPISSSYTVKKDNLPLPSTDFVGREAELAELSRILATSAIRLVTIVAPGGMGKTSLSIELGRRELAAFADGVYFVELAALTNPDSIIVALADATGFQSGEDGRPLKQQMLEFLASRQVLLIMDNFEHLLEAASVVADILKTAPEVKVVATSRQALKLAGESLFHLAGMDFPDWETPEDALEYAAVKLFMNSAVRAFPGFKLTQDNLDHVARICRLVQGMPLGIVLAASWLAMLSPAEIAAEIQQNMDILEDETGQVPERQRSIRAVMDYSWAIMNAAEQEAFMKLSVFRGGFTREAAQAIANANLRILMGLTTKSLLRRDAESGRYLIHELLRQYGEEKLKASGQADAVYAAYAAFYLDFLAQYAPGLKGGDQQFKILDDLEADFDNIQLAWKQAVIRQDSPRLLNALEAFELFCNLRSRWRDAQILFDFTREAPLPETLQERVKIRFNAHTPSPALLEAALVRAKAQGDVKEAAYCLGKLGELAHNIQQNPKQAVVYFEEAAGIYRQLGEMHYLAETLMKLSESYQQLGDYQKSVPLVNESHAILLQHQDKLGAAKTLRAKAMDFYMRGKFIDYLPPLKESYDIYFHAKNLMGQAETRLFLGWLDHRVGKFQQGKDIVDQARQLADSIGAHTTQAWATAKLSSFCSNAGDIAAAEHWLAEAEAIETNPFQQTGAGGGVLAFLMTEAKALIALGHQDYATSQQHLRLLVQQAYGMYSVGFLMEVLPSVMILNAQTMQCERAAEIVGALDTLVPQGVVFFDRWTLYNAMRDQLKECLDEAAYQSAWERGNTSGILAVAQQVLADWDQQ